MKFNYDYVKKSMLDQTKERCEADFLNKQPLCIAEINDGILLPGKMKEGGGIFDQERYYDQSFLHNAHPWAKAYAFDESELVYDDREVLYLGMLHDVWGHFITDCLTKLWPLFSEKVPGRIRNTKCIYTTLRNKPIPSSYFEVFRLIGIDIEGLEYISKPTKFKKIYLPDSSFYIDTNKGYRMYSPEFLDTINRITANIEADERYAKLYFTRTAVKNQRDFGEDAIEKAFKDLGYSIVSPEKHSFAEQVAMLKGCKTFASTEGSCSHNALFLTPGSKTIIIRKIDYLNGYQYQINSMKDLDITYIDANLSHLRIPNEFPGYGPFFLYINKRMAAFAGIPAHFPLSVYLKYFKFAQKKKLAFLKHRIRRFFK